MRIGFFGGTDVQSVPPTFVLMPVYPSTQAIAVGQPVLATIALVAAMSRRSLVKGGPPVGNSPSSITSFFTLVATKRSSPQRTALTRTGCQQAGQVGVAADSDDGHAVVRLGRQQPTIEIDRRLGLRTVPNGVRELLRKYIAVAVWCRVGGAVGHGPDRYPAVTVRRIDGIERSGSHRIPNIRHDPEDLDLAPLLKDVGHADRRGVVPPQGEISVDDDALRTVVGCTDRCRRG